MTPPPSGRRALITGSFQGIGLAIAEALAAESCHIVLHGLATAAQQEASRAAVLAAGGGLAYYGTSDVRSEYGDVVTTASGLKYKVNAAPRSK